VEADSFLHKSQHNSNNVTLSQFSDNSFASSTTSIQSSTPIFPSRNLADFDILKLLGTGGTARVYLARDKRTENLVALKVISKTGRNKAKLNDVIIEQKIHRLVSDPADKFILPILGSWHDEFNFFIVTVG
jgi:serine/threonine protein kinase